MKILAAFDQNFSELGLDYGLLTGMILVFRLKILGRKLGGQNHLTWPQKLA